MANSYLPTNSARWNAALANHEAAHAAALAMQELQDCRVRNEIFELAAGAAERLFRVPSPTIGALRVKLETLFGESIWDEDEGGNIRRTVIGDLRRLELLLAGAEPHEASGGMDLSKLAADWAEAASKYSKSASPAEKSALATSLLQLSAPDLAAVEAKLMILAASDDYVDRFAACNLVQIIRDLKRFVATDDLSVSAS